MGKRLRHAPDAEWVLMYRHGLSRQRIAALVRAAPATVGYHLGIARRQDPNLEPAHLSAAGTALPPAAIARMHEVTAWVSAWARLPSGHSQDTAERSMAAWLGRRRREAAAGNLHPAYREGLARVTGWDGSARAAAGEARWRELLVGLVRFRAEGNDWPRHHHYASEREHTLGVWIHAQRQKHRNGALDAVKIRLLDDAVPGWQMGRRRGRPPRP